MDKNYLTLVSTDPPNILSTFSLFINFYKMLVVDTNEGVVVYISLEIEFKSISRVLFNNFK
jgi:hypothetical protein